MRTGIPRRRFVKLGMGVAGVAAVDGNIRAATKPSRFAILNGLRIHYEDYGAALNDLTVAPPAVITEAAPKAPRFRARAAGPPSDRSAAEPAALPIQLGREETAARSSAAVLAPAVAPSKPALVFIHGWACDLTFWRGQEALYNNPNRRSLLIDLPGHGASDKPYRAYPIEFFARAVEAVMRDAHVERAVLIGHSLGGPIAYAFLRLFPEKVRALVLVDAFVSRHMAGPPDRAATAVYFAKVARSLQGRVGEKNFAERVESCFTAQTPDPLRAEIRAKMAATPKHVRIAALSSISSLHPPPKDEIFDLPSIAIQAADRHTEERYELMRTIFTRMQLDKWEGAGHFLMMEEPQRFNREAEQFLASLP